jgi:hypothetical protein
MNTRYDHQPDETMKNYSSDEQQFKTEIIPVMMPFPKPPRTLIALEESCPMLARHCDQVEI